ncbi:hypothetical protein DFP72DRAFT_840615 [Ephemerocybe angulata]|uniref:Uncharacterized protein n=1 Tax=Ephemerocybe angulata TaxID=980116 RepID=A0A8H6IFB8_9AGAR|nr:hypothetical protein DFP72DRAFT_840615 [Tulosesus angulatus]
MSNMEAATWGGWDPKIPTNWAIYGRTPYRHMDGHIPGVIIEGEQPMNSLDVGNISSADDQRPGSNLIRTSGMDPTKGKGTSYTKIPTNWAIYGRTPYRHMDGHIPGVIIEGEQPMNSLDVGNISSADDQRPGSNLIRTSGMDPTKGKGTSYTNREPTPRSGYLLKALGAVRQHGTRPRSASKRDFAIFPLAALPGEKSKLETRFVQYGEIIKELSPSMPPPSQGSMHADRRIGILGKVTEIRDPI